ncbi:asparagine synthase (glutamine-hydrolyzing) [Terricaulis silvestris]|uniref:asparagine synthase (glutamine-hydrolyzing) n=1 Tax=Terricaulis silvestris TaxID=2686094 RepID=A0A6I6MFT8_9CAUL|nr:asparagine synthase (glutamine-hydrolyzing) [Terricaulis silvestris]QGZ93405.1 Asparagine synthetase [glutamine-hydrolyzing] 1 [Terricaulis silvestris]
MCGINGIFAYNRSAGPPHETELVATRDYMRARGPDGVGEWWSDDTRLCLGHRRLSIIDLSERALQPMESSDGRFVIVFNGEIYNHPDLRIDLESSGVRFKTTSDTETLLHLYERHGADMVHRLRGMFAFAIWDTTERSLFLARDPYGIKPLYTANDGWSFRFASQVKALLAGGKVSRDPEPAGIVGFHLWGSVPEPFTLYRDIRALPAGHTQYIDAAGPREPKAYTSIAQLLAEGASNPAPAGEAINRIAVATLDSVRAHLLADVEVGVFLSAGVDSGALLGLMRDAGQNEIRAVTLAFEEFSGGTEDEVPLARDVAKLYQAEHIVRVVSHQEFKSDLPAILQAMDQPSIDGINTWFVAKAAREVGLKVALSGLGGDEIFAGYPSFRDLPRWVNLFALPAKIPGAGIATRALLGFLGVAKQSPKAVAMLEYGGTYSGAYLLRRGLFLPFDLKTVLDPELVRHGLRRLAPIRRLKQSMHPDPKEPISRVAALESANYMRNQLLRDADWAGMAHSLEIRVPLVDSELLRSIAPVISRFKPGVGKRALARAPSTPLPVSVTDRPKSGFGVPIGGWIDHSAHAIAQSKGAASRAWACEVWARSSSSDETPAALPS